MINILFTFILLCMKGSDALFDVVEVDESVTHYLM